jgi:hypothetical protein
MTLALAIFVSVMIGRVGVAAGIVSFFICLEESTKETVNSDLRFEAADVDNYRAQIEKMNAIEACTQKLLEES